MKFKEKLEPALKVIRERTNIQPKVGLILGSGLGPLAEQIENPVTISYQDLPCFPTSRVAGHEGSMVFGELEGVPVVCLKGRVHFYEGIPLESVKILIRILKCLGCHTVVMTNAGGSLRYEVGAGEIVLIKDHISFVQHNPLVGLNDDDFGPRFVPMNDAYDPLLREKILKTAKSINLPLTEGVYLAVIGPCFETPAEIQTFRIWGADIVGMSTIPEVIVARHCDLKVIAISAITNLGAGMHDEKPSHEGTLHNAQFAGKKLSQLLVAFFKEYAHEFKN